MLGDDGATRDLNALQARIVELEAELERQRVSAEKLDALLACLPIVVWEIDAHGIVTATEGNGLSILGLRPNQTVGASIREMYAEAPHILSHMERALRGESFSANNEVAGIRFQNHYFARRDQDGAVSGLLGVTFVASRPTDAALERERAEHEVQDKQKQESLAVLAGGIAHDFNNLLVGSLGHADLALRLVPPKSDLGDHLREIIRSSERAADLCSQLLAYAGRGQFIVKVVDLNRLVEDSMHLMELTVAKTSVLRAELAPNLPPLRGDATQIVQVLINLIKNASDAAEGKPATIRISSGVRYVEPDQQRLTVIAPSSKPGNYVFVSVRDQGVGMRPEVIGRIFDPFYSTKQTGRGLGLAAVVGIVRGHGGMLDVESKIGVGTTMVVYFPALDVIRPATLHPELPPLQHTSGTILLVDDEPGPRRVARSMLEDTGCKVLEAHNGREAVELYVAKRGEISTVLMDLSMPVLDGAAALRELRAIDPEAKVILVSGYAERDIITELAGLRPNAFLLKPYRYDQLLEALNSVATTCATT